MPCNGALKYTNQMRALHLVMSTTEPGQSGGKCRAPVNPASSRGVPRSPNLKKRAQSAPQPPTSQTPTPTFLVLAATCKDGPGYHLGALAAACTAPAGLSGHSSSRSQVTMSSAEGRSSGFMRVQA